MIHWNGTYEIRFQPREFDGPNKSGRSSIRSADQEHENNWWTRLVSDTVEGEMNNCLDRPKQFAYGQEYRAVLDTIVFKHMNMTKTTSIRRKGRSVGCVWLEIDLLNQIVRFTQRETTEIVYPSNRPVYEQQRWDIATSRTRSTTEQRIINRSHSVFVNRKTNRKISWLPSLTN